LLLLLFVFFLVLLLLLFLFLLILLLLILLLFVSVLLIFLVLFLLILVLVLFVLFLFFLVLLILLRLGFLNLFEDFTCLLRRWIGRLRFLLFERLEHALHLFDGLGPQLDRLLVARPHFLGVDRFWRCRAGIGRLTLFRGWLLILLRSV